MKNDIRLIKNNLTTKQELELQKDREKELKREYKKDIEYLILYEIEQNYNINKSFYKILDNQDNICENVFNKMSDLINELEPVKETDAPIGEEVKKIPNYKYKNVDYNDIENVFLKVYNQFKRKQELIEKAKAKDIEDIYFKALVEVFERGVKEYNKNLYNTIVTLQKEYYDEFVKDIENRKNIDLSNTFSIFLKAKKKFKLEYETKQPIIEEEPKKIPFVWKWCIFMKLLLKMCKK